MNPSAAISWISSGGTFPCSSISRARGRTFSRAKSRAVRWASCCSSVSARSKPVAVSVVVTVSTMRLPSVSVVLIRVEADVAAVGVASVEVVALELADRAARGFRARIRAGDVVDAEPDDEPALSAHVRLRLAIVGVMHDDLRVVGREPGRARLGLRLQPGYVGVKAHDLRALVGERHDRADARWVLVTHSASTASATASPPPRQRETTPRFLPRARSA